MLRGWGGDGGRDSEKSGLRGGLDLAGLGRSNAAPVHSLNESKRLWVN
jgi:hypothetical protein